MLRFRSTKPKLLTIIGITSLLLSASVVLIVLRAIDIQNTNNQIDYWETSTATNLSCSQFCKSAPEDNDSQCCDAELRSCIEKSTCFDDSISQLHRTIDQDKSFIIWTGIPAIIQLTLIVTLAIYGFRLWRAAQREQREPAESSFLHPFLQEHPQENVILGFDQESFDTYEEFMQYILDGEYIPGLMAPEIRGDSRITDSFLTMDEENCSICIASFSEEKVLKLPCGHKFHSQCIRDWNQAKSSCPVCRADIYPREQMPDEIEEADIYPREHEEIEEADGSGDETF